MSTMDLFKTTTSAEKPLDSSHGTPESPGVSDFVTVQSLANFAVMTGAITASWNALKAVTEWGSQIWVPYAFALTWGIISLVMSLEGLKKDHDDGARLDLGSVLAAGFIARINSLVLAGAVVGTSQISG